MSPDQLPDYLCWCTLCGTHHALIVDRMCPVCLDQTSEKEVRHA